MVQDVVEALVVRNYEILQEHRPRMLLPTIPPDLLLPMEHSRGHLPETVSPDRFLSMIRILLAEDQQLLRGALASLIDLEGDLEVVAEVERGDEVLTAAIAACPDVAILDIQMCGMSGLDAARTLSQELPGCRILILTTFGRPGYLQQAMEAGVSGFLLKDSRVDELANAIRRITRGERVIDMGLAASALSSGNSPLTPREEDVLEQARTGATVAEMADATYLSPGTVRNYLSSAMTKLGARTRTEAARIADEKGWLRPT